MHLCTYRCACVCSHVRRGKRLLIHQMDGRWRQRTVGNAKMFPLIFLPWLSLLYGGLSAGPRSCLPQSHLFMLTHSPTSPLRVLFGHFLPPSPSRLSLDPGCSVTLSVCRSCAFHLTCLHQVRRSPSLLFFLFLGKNSRPPFSALHSSCPRLCHST